jgi:hypothetical protein
MLALELGKCKYLPAIRTPGWGLWQVRQRIAQAHRLGLGERAGALVSAMALD